MVTGYTIFYEGNSTAATAITASQTTMLQSGSLLPPAPVMQVFDSFELMAGEEVEQAASVRLYY
jgi:hypothetical protein